MKTKTTFYCLLFTTMMTMIIITANAQVNAISYVQPISTDKSCRFEIILEMSTSLPCNGVIQIIDRQGVTVDIINLQATDVNLSVSTSAELSPSSRYDYSVFIGGGIWNGQFYTKDLLSKIDDVAKSAISTKILVSGSNLLLTSSPELLGKKGLIYDYTGKAVSEFVIENTIQNIDISGLPKGFYLLSADRLVIRIVIMN